MGASVWCGTGCFSTSNRRVAYLTGDLYSLLICLDNKAMPLHNISQDLTFKNSISGWYDYAMTPLRYYITDTEMFSSNGNYVSNLYSNYDKDELVQFLASYFEYELAARIAGFLVCL